MFRALKMVYDVIKTFGYVDRVRNLIYDITDRECSLGKYAVRYIGHIWNVILFHKAFRRFSDVPAFFLAERVAEARVPRRLHYPTRGRCRVIRL